MLFTHLFGRPMAENDECRMIYNAHFLQVLVPENIEFILIWFGLIRRKLITES